MSRKEYLDRLKEYLQGLPKDEIEDIMVDYEEHFNIGISKGKAEEEISKELGDPREVASSYKTNDGYSGSNVYETNFNNNTRKILITLVLLAFNIIIVAGPYFGLLGLLIGVYGVGIGFLIGGILTLVGHTSIVLPFVSYHILTSISFCIGFISLGALVIILAVYITKKLYKLTISYIRWNIELINRGV